MSDGSGQLEDNKRVVTALYTKAIFEGDVDTAVRLYGGTSYTQHTPFAANGFDGLRQYVSGSSSTTRRRTAKSNECLPMATMCCFTATGQGFSERTGMPLSTSFVLRAEKSWST